MRCLHCQSENSPTNAFCTACGKPLGLACPACSHINPPGAHYCGRCSAALEEAGAAHEGASPAAQQVLRALASSGGERKRLTLLFADIVDSTRLIGGQDPEDALQLLQPGIEVMRDAVDRHGGVVVRVQGDGILALFGAPQPHEDHALRACAAALAMQAGIHVLQDSRLRIRVGLNTGVVVTQAVQNSLGQLMYDVAGAAAHLAARMEQMAQPGEVLLAGETFSATRQSVEAASLGRREVRGIGEPVEVYRLLGLRHAPASEIFRNHPRLSKLSGRDWELGALHAELANAAIGDARAVGITGAAGAGKSRLCFEFGESCRIRGIHIFETRALAHARDTPYQPVLKLMRDWLGLTAGQTADAARLQVSSVLRNLPAGAETLPLLLEFLGLSDASNPAPTADPAVRKARLLDLVRNFVRSGRRNEPTVILVEDLHWIDSASGEFIEAMVDAVPGTKTLLLMNYRSEYSAGWMQRSHFRQVTLSPLTRAGMETLLDGLLGSDASVAQLKQDVAERAQGNPFFAEELVHTLLERGHLQGLRGSYRLAQQISSLPLPSTIEALLAARIDRLDEAAKRILQCASVIGHEVPGDILEDVSKLSSEELSQPLARLRRAEFLRELSTGRLGRHAFAHPLVQEVCYRSLLRERRRRIHADVAKVIKRQSTEPWEQRTSMLAYHLEEAGELMEAAQATISSAMWTAAHDSRQALRSWKKVHHLLSSLPSSDSTNWLRVNACLQILGFGWREGLSLDEAEVLFEEAKEIAQATNNLRANAWAHAAFGRVLAVAGSADEYVRRVREALALSREANDKSSEVMLTASLSQALRLAGHLCEALKANVEATDRMHEINDFDRQLMGFAVERWLAAMRGQILVLLGRFDDARYVLDRLLQAANDTHDITRHLANAAYVDLAWGAGDMALAEFHADQVQNQAEESGSTYVGVSARACRALCDMMGGRFLKAANDIAVAVDFARERRAGLETEPRLLADLANALRLHGDFDGASRAARLAIGVSQQRAARVAKCLARIVLAHALIAAGDTNRALDELRKIRALLRDTGANLYYPLVQDLATHLGSKGGPSESANNAPPL